MFDTLYAQIGAIFMVAMGLFAFIKGDDLERIGAGSFLLAWLASLLVQEESNLREPQIAMMAIDAALLVVFAGLAWRAPRNWPVWAAGLQLLVVTSHVFTLIGAQHPVKSLYVIMSLAGYIQIILIILGTFWAWQNRRAAGLE